MDLKIRKLTVADNDRLTDMLLNMSSKVEFSNLRSMVKTDSESDGEQQQAEEGKEEKVVAFFTGLIGSLLNVYREDVRRWFADLVGMTYDQYMLEAPFDADMQIIGQIKEAPGFVSFFVKACAVFNLQKILGNISKTVKENFVSLTN